MTEKHFISSDSHIPCLESAGWSAILPKSKVKLKVKEVLGFWFPLTLGTTDQPLPSKRREQLTEQWTVLQQPHQQSNHKYENNSELKMCCVLCLAAQSCLTLCDPMDCSPPGSSIHGILQARILEWVLISFCKGSSQTRDQTWVSHIADRFFTIWATGGACGENLFKLILRERTQLRFLKVAETSRRNSVKPLSIGRVLGRVRWSQFLHHVGERFLVRGPTPSSHLGAHLLSSFLRLFPFDGVLLSPHLSALRYQGQAPAEVVSTLPASSLHPLPSSSPSSLAGPCDECCWAEWKAQAHSGESS